MAIKSFNRNQWLQRGSAAARRSIKQSEDAADYKEFLAREKAKSDAAKQEPQPAPTSQKDPLP